MPSADASIVASATGAPDMLASPGYQLARVRFFELQDIADLPVWIVKRFPENIRCSLHRREFLEK